MSEKNKFIELNEEDLEKVSGGEMVYTDQFSQLEQGLWYSNDYEADYRYKVLDILFDTDKGLSSIRFNRYWYDPITNRAWNCGDYTISGSDSWKFRLQSAPGIIETTFTGSKPF